MPIFKEFGPSVSQIFYLIFKKKLNLSKEVKFDFRYQQLQCYKFLILKLNYLVTCIIYDIACIVYDEDVTYYTNIYKINRI